MCIVGDGELTTDKRPRAARRSRAIRWEDNLNGVAAWVETYGRLPKHNSNRSPSTSDDRLARFLTDQRVRNDLRPDQLDALLSLPGFEFNPSGTAFESKARSYVEFRLKHHRDPRRSRTATAEERALAEWARRACVNVKTGHLTYLKLESLRTYGIRWTKDVVDE